MKLSVVDRLVIQQILPKEEDYTTLKLIRKFRESLSFSEEEHKRYKFKMENGQLLWDNSNEAEKDVHVGEVIEKIVIESLKKLDKQHKLVDDYMDVYEKFVGEQV